MASIVNVSNRRRSTSYRNSQLINAGSVPSESNNELPFVHVTVDPLLSTTLGLSPIRAFVAITRSFLPSTHSSISSISLFVIVLILLTFLLHAVDFSYFLLHFIFFSFSLFTISCIFCWFALIFRHSWTTSCAYILFCACVIGEIASRVVVTFEVPSLTPATTTACNHRNELIIQPYSLRPSELLVFLLAVITAISYNYLSCYVNVLLIFLVTAVRYFAYAMLVDIPCMFRPYAAYMAGICGIIAAKHTETMFTRSISTSTNHDGKLIAVKRRRASSTLHPTGHVSALSSNTSTVRNRRTSLPALSIQRVHHGNHMIMQVCTLNPIFSRQYRIYSAIVTLRTLFKHTIYFYRNLLINHNTYKAEVSHHRLH